LRYAATVGVFGSLTTIPPHRDAPVVVLEVAVAFHLTVRAGGLRNSERDERGTGEAGVWLDSRAVPDDVDHTLRDIGGFRNFVVERDPVDLRCQTKVAVGGGGVQAIFLNRVRNQIGRWHRSE